MGKAENRIESAVNNYAQQQGFLTRKYNSPNVRGVPDQIYFGYGQVFLMEFKAPNGVLSGHQEREIKRLKAHGVRVFVVDSIELGEQIVDGARIVGEKESWHVM